MAPIRDTASSSNAAGSGASQVCVRGWAELNPKHSGVTSRSRGVIRAGERYSHIAVGCGHNLAPLAQSIRSAGLSPFPREIPHSGISTLRCCSIVTRDAPPQLQQQAQGPDLEPHDASTPSGKDTAPSSQLCVQRRHHPAPRLARSSALTPHGRGQGSR
ncbi:hypothetical protein NDU88_001266 [Pleurodeles waltl]|uniref:Uncharacterized protein n=1 Tax=Pleurodeles waltl TaxID=8319 RepID=A0AAV7THU4_PLEWA|nr:hypothetical protein NDU88_001266 [Pleurodeles waltl]